MTPTGYRGRFAPTPSGPLHLGSLLTALASCLHARAQGGHWLLRIDDLDRARLAPGAEDRILRQLECHGLHWDEAPRRQSEHLGEYHEAIAALRSQGLLYACVCSRSTLATQSLPGPDAPVYAGTCRNAGHASANAALRLRVPDQALTFRDAGQGLQQRNLLREVGDWVVLRRDGVVAYQLACAVDEHAQHITEVVRGADLLTSSFRQLHLMELLRLRTPGYRHLPVLVDSTRRKLSKQNRAAPLEERHAPENLLRCLEWLGQQPPAALRRARVADVLAWGIEHWTPERLPARPEIELRSL